MVDVYYNVYIYTAQVHPFVRKGCAMCYIHIYLVGVGVSSYSILDAIGFLIPQFARAYKE